jgi:general secretion pathway protein G
MGRKWKFIAAGIIGVVLIVILVSLPPYQKSQMRMRENVLKGELYTFRTVIDQYTFDKKRAPATLQDLVAQGYLRGIPVDPMTGSGRTWRVIEKEGIWDVRSGSDKKSLEGPRYSDW